MDNKFLAKKLIEAIKEKAEGSGWTGKMLLGALLKQEQEVEALFTSVLDKHNIRSENEN